MHERIRSIPKIWQIGLVSFGMSFVLFAFMLKVSLAKDHRLFTVSAPTPPPSSPSSTPTPTVTPTPTPKPTPRPKPTSTPLPTPTVKPYTAADMDRWFQDASKQYTVSEALLKKIAICESLLNPLARNGPYSGLFQFAISAWKSARTGMGADENPQLRFDPEEAIKTAAYKIHRDGPGAWPLCSR